MHRFPDQLQPVARAEAIIDDHDVMTRCLQAIWRDGAALDDALAGAEAEIQALLR